MAEEIVNVGYLRDPETHEIFLPQTDESLVTGLTNKIDTAINNKISSLDGNATVTDTGTGVNVITEVSETDGILSSKQKTITEGSKIDVTGASGSITIAHESITTTPTDNSVNPPDGLGDGERESYVITDVTTDGYGHITAYTKDKSTNLIAADIKAPVKVDNNNMFTFRETGDPVSISEDAAKIKVVKGNTLKWNQLFNFDNISGISYVTKTATGFIIQGTISSSTYPTLNSINVIAGHKYACICHYTGTDSSNTTWQMFENSTVAGSMGHLENSAILTCSTSGTFNLALAMYEGATLNVTISVMFVNLTAMFGEGNEPTTVAEFEKLFHAPYYPYCEGRLVNLGGYGVKLNQLCNYEDISTYGDTPIGVQVSASGDIITVSNTLGLGYGYQDIHIPMVVGHKYYVAGTAKGSLDSTPILRVYYGTAYNYITIVATSSANTWYTGKNIITCADATYRMIRYEANTQGETNQYKDIMCIDLTLMFGSGSEPSTVEEVEAILSLIKAQKGITDDYIPYTEGEDMNPVSELGIESTGFNQWDEEWESGYYTEEGVEYADNHAIRTKNFTEVFPNTSYFWQKPYEGRVYFYDGGKGLLGRTEALATSQVIPTPSNCHYIKFFVFTEIANYEYEDNICFNLSCDRNGTYEPYRKDTLDLSFIKDLGIPNFNIWDEEWEAGTLNTSDGTPSSAYSTTRIRSKSFIPVEFGETYYFNFPTYSGISSIAYWFKYDENRNFIGIGTSSTLKIDDGTRYIKFFTNDYYLIIHSNVMGYYYDICINKSVPGINGTYLPHGESYYYFKYGVASANAAYDEANDTYAIKRTAEVDLGDLNWVYNLSGAQNEFAAVVFNGKFPSSGSVNPNAVCSLYEVKNYSYSSLNSMQMSFADKSYDQDNPNVICKNSSYTDAATFKAAMKGVKLIYEISVPVRIEYETPHTFNYAVDDKGTEALIPQNTSNAVVTAPFAGTITYMSNFKEGVLDLMGRFNDFIPTTKIIPDSATANSTLPTSQAVIDYLRAGGNGVKPVYESGDEVTPTTDVHAGLKTEVGNNSYKYYKVPFSAVTNDPSTGTSQVQIILNGNFS